jgi:hypothetical protein
MKPIKTSDEIMKQIEELESKKQYQTTNVNMKSKIIGHSNSRIPSYFIRADYFKDEKLSKQPQEYWSIPNPNDPYFTDCRSRMDNMKALITLEKTKGIQTSTEYYYKNIKTRYNFLIESRKISALEMDERIANERVQLIKR